MISFGSGKDSGTSSGASYTESALPYLSVYCCGDQLVINDWK
ncbi:hypothetical protein [Microbulbifer sp. A4B17]|nr:hypothetical protein [Microbulbifer sp. A4B17]